MLWILPATVQTPVVDFGERPQNMSADVKLAIGLLSMTVLAHVFPESVDPTQICCHVEWAETDAAAARRTVKVFIFLFPVGKN